MSPYDPARHGPKRIVGPGFHDRVFALVQTVPPGFVTTYGDLATALGSRNVARHVGYAMAAIPAGRELPWWRVVAAGGRLSVAGDNAARQAKRLAAEGVEVVGSRVRRFAAHRHVFAAEAQ